MRLFSNEHTYTYPWHQVTFAHWLKYPNPFASHVVHVDVLHRTVDPNTGILRTERIIACQQNVPAIIRKLFGSELTFALEVSEIDPLKKIHTAHAVNLSGSNIIRITEKYTFSETKKEHTLFKQEASIHTFGLFSSLAGYLEEFSLKRFGENAAIGKRGFEQVLERLIQESPAM